MEDLGASVRFIIQKKKKEKLREEKIVIEVAPDKKKERTEKSRFCENDSYWLNRVQNHAQ